MWRIGSWQYVLKQNVLRVPEGCSTMHQALELAVIFSERNECTRVNPVKVEVGEGEHEMVGVTAPGIYGGLLMHVSCSNITIVGKGKGKTTILGGFYVNGKQNVKMEQLSVTNEAGTGLLCPPKTPRYAARGLLQPDRRRRRRRGYRCNSPVPPPTSHLHERDLPHAQHHTRTSGARP